MSSSNVHSPSLQVRRRGSSSDLNGEQSPLQSSAGKQRVSHGVAESKSALALEPSQPELSDFDVATRSLQDEIEQIAAKKGVARQDGDIDQLVDIFVQTALDVPGARLARLIDLRTGQEKRRSRRIEGKRLDSLPDKGVVVNLQNYWVKAFSPLLLDAEVVAALRKHIEAHAKPHEVNGLKMPRGASEVPASFAAFFRDPSAAADPAQTQAYIEISPPPAQVDKYELAPVPEWVQIQIKGGDRAFPFEIHIADDSLLVPFGRFTEDMVTVRRGSGERRPIEAEYPPQEVAIRYGNGLLRPWRPAELPPVAARGAKHSRALDAKGGAEHHVEAAGVGQSEQPIIDAVPPAELLRLREPIPRQEEDRRFEQQPVKVVVNNGWTEVQLPDGGGTRFEFLSRPKAPKTSV